MKAGVRRDAAGRLDRITDLRAVLAGKSGEKLVKSLRKLSGDD